VIIEWEGGREGERKSRREGEEEGKVVGGKLGKDAWRLFGQWAERESRERERMECGGDSAGGDGEL
jgi:hypothetical protein